MGSIYGPIVYRLGHNVLNVGSGVRFPVGSKIYKNGREERLFLFLIFRPYGESKDGAE